MAFGTFIAHASFCTVRLTSPAEALWYARALPVAIQARPHWQAAITAAQNAERSASQIDKAADALKAALKADSLFVSWSRLPEF